MPDQDGTLTAGAVSMPGSAPFPCLIMCPDDSKPGLERISASIENAIGELAQWVNDMDAAREMLLG